MLINLRKRSVTLRHITNILQPITTVSFSSIKPVRQCRGDARHTTATAKSLDLAHVRCTTTFYRLLKKNSTALLALELSIVRIKLTEPLRIVTHQLAAHKINNAFFPLYSLCCINILRDISQIHFEGKSSARLSAMRVR